MREMRKILAIAWLVAVVGGIGYALVAASNPFVHALGMAAVVVVGIVVTTIALLALMD